MTAPSPPLKPLWRITLYNGCCSMKGKRCTCTDAAVVLGTLAPGLMPAKAPKAGGKRRYASLAWCVAKPSCRRLLLVCVRAAASRTFCTAGTNRAIRIAMMAMTTSNSISVNADRRAFGIAFPPRSPTRGENFTVCLLQDDGHDRNDALYFVTFRPRQWQVK